MHTTSVPKFSRAEVWLFALVTIAAIGVGGLGLASSFSAVSEAGTRWGFQNSWMLPVGIDIAIPVFTAAQLLLIRADMPLGWVRWVPWVLTGVTCWLNVAAGHSLSAKIAHGTMPLLWVVLSEIAAHVYATRIGAVTGKRMEKIRRSRWFLAPLSTFTLWRRMTLWEVTSYSEALSMERDRQLAIADQREKFGRKWKTETPARELVLMRMGAVAIVSDTADAKLDITPAVVDIPQVTAPDTVQTAPAEVSTPAPAVQDDFTEAVQIANSGRKPKPAMADVKAILAELSDKGVTKSMAIDQAIADKFGVSTRTARRYVKEVTG